MPSWRYSRRGSPIEGLTCACRCATAWYGVTATRRVRRTPAEHAACGTEQHGADGLFEAGVGVGDDQLHPAESAGLQAAQEGGPEGAIFAVDDGEAEDFPPPVGANPGGDHDRLGDHPPVDPGLAVGRVQKHIRERRRGQRPVPKRRDFLVQVGADPRHL